jgi:hypothetical protein
MQMATVGYGDIIPTSVVEMCTMLVCMIIGAIVFGYVIGTVSVFATTVNQASVRHKNRMLEMIDYLHHRKAPKDMFTRACLQYDNYLGRKSTFDENVILAELPESLRQEVRRRHAVAWELLWRFTASAPRAHCGRETPSLRDTYMHAHTHTHTLLPSPWSSLLRCDGVCATAVPTRR